MAGNGLKSQSWHQAFLFLLNSAPAALNVLSQIAGMAALMFLVSGCCTTQRMSQDRASSLRGELNEAIEKFDGEVGVYFRKLDDTCEIAIRAEELFPTASLIKVPMTMALLAQVEAGLLDWKTPIVHQASKSSKVGEDLMAKFMDGSQISLDKLIFLTQSVSDNTAARLVQDLAGGGAAINQWLALQGWEQTRVNARVENRSQDYQFYGWGQTTPKEMAGMLVALRERRAISPQADEYLDRMLGKAYWDDEALSAIPSDIHVISKQGAVNASRSEVLLVSAPSGPYVLCVITRNQTDQSWGDDNEGFQLLRRISQLVWNAMEPNHPYETSIKGPEWPHH